MPFATPPEQGTSGTSPAPAKTKFSWARNANEATIAALIAVQKTGYRRCKENKKAFEDLAKDALSLIDAIYRGCEDVMEQRNPPASIEQLNIHAEALTKILKEIRDTAKQRTELPAYKRFFASRTDPSLVKNYREKLNFAMGQFQTECHISVLKASGRFESFIETRLMPVLSRMDRRLASTPNPPGSDSPRDAVEPAPQIVLPESDSWHAHRSHTPLHNAVDSAPQIVAPESHSGDVLQRHPPPRETGPDRGNGSTTASAPDSRPPISREATSSNHLRSGGETVISRSRSSAPSSTPGRSDPTPPVNLPFQPQSPSPSQASSPASVSMFNNSTVTMGAGSTTNTVSGHQHNTYNSAPMHAYGPNVHNFSTGAYPHHFSPPPPPPHHYGWGSPPPPGSRYAY
ncbi:hypothetical protein PM082_011756 [Marasmius tenuissimus]|nr:hypothetical protein PM082_011756 [Marasmius tenuissimus]